MGLLSRFTFSGPPRPEVAASRLSARTMWTVAITLVAVHAIAAWLARQPAILTADDARYIVLAQWLRNLSYQNLHDVTLPAHGLYPPVYWSGAGELVPAAPCEAAGQTSLLAAGPAA